MAHPILLPSILHVADPSSFKLHLASKNSVGRQPLDVFVNDRDEWNGWNAWRTSRDDFSRDHILALIDFYPQPGTWLFGGAYRVLDRKPIDNARSYTIEALREFEPFVGRLKVWFTRPARGKAHNFEKHYSTMQVAELLPETYSGEAFPGHDWINAPFSALESIVRTQKSDWKAALENTKGVYLVTDGETGKQYVGSAYGDAGIWSRWCSYTTAGHGDNVELCALLDERGIEHARAHFRFAILELCSTKAADADVIAREQHWKNVLRTREHGHNRN